MIAKAFVDLIAAAELKYQTALNESYRDLADDTFNGLRRALPYTRTKVDWNKVKLDLSPSEERKTVLIVFIASS